MRRLLFPTLLVSLALGSCVTSGQARPELDLASDGWRLLEINDDAGALATFDRALAVEASAPNHAGRGRALQGLGRTLEARSAFRQAIALEPTNARWHVGLGVVELAGGDVAAAVTACDAAIDRDPRGAKAYYNRGCAMLQVGEHEQAVADFSSAIRWNPKDPAAHNSLGVALASLERFDAATECFLRASSLGVLPAAHANCAAAYYRCGEIELALTELNTAIRLERNNITHLTNRGRIYLDLGESRLALVDFVEARKLAPQDPAVRDLVAQTRRCVAEQESAGGAAGGSATDLEARGR